MRLPQKDRTDWLAFLLVLLIFAALLAALMSVATGSHLPLIDR